MAWQKDLNGIMGGYFCDSSVEEGAAELVFVSETNPEYHHLYSSTFEQAVKVAAEGTPEDKTELITILRRSNLAVGTAEEAHLLLTEVQAEYLKQYQAAVVSEE